MAQPFLLSFLFIFSLLTLLPVHSQDKAIFDITKYGATSSSDISQALLSAWMEARASVVPAKVVIPAGTWQLNQIYMEGPTMSPVELNLQGTLIAPTGALPHKDASWITIIYIDRFEMSGGGVIDGKGKQAWTQNDCSTNSKCEQLPMNLSFDFLNNSYIHDITSKDSKNFHSNCISSSNITFQRYTISAPGDSPNTDGLHVARSRDIHIIDSIIGTGDDCISIGDDSNEIHITNVTCGPGHGISIGSLGKSEAEKDVRGIYVKNCFFNNSDNGIRIKTWPSAPGRLNVSNLDFSDIKMNNVTNPIVLDQQYCPWNMCDKSKPSLVQIRNVTIKNIEGTSSSPVVVSMECSSSNPCKDVTMNNINIKSTSIQEPASAKINNIKPTCIGQLNPPVCGSGEL